MADKTQHIMWTALPNGYAEGRGYKVSVLVSPELTRTPAVPHTLDQFPDLVDWPATISKIKFAFTYHNAVIQNPQLDSIPDSKVWTSVFPPTTFVRSHQFEDRRGTVVLSYPLDTVHDFVRETYANLVAEAGDELPERIEHIRNLRKLVEKLPEPKEILAALRDPEYQLDPKDLYTAWALLQAYHRPLSAEEPAFYFKDTSGPEEDPREDAKWRTHKLVDLPKDHEFQTLIDFHQIVSSTNQYHGLLRKLGLVLDFILPEDKMPAVAMTERLRLRPNWVPTLEAVSGVKTLDDTRPFTVTRLEPQTDFRAVKQLPSTPVIDGYLELSERFRLIQIDVDGAGIKTKNFAQTLLTMKGAATHEPEPRVGAPALQTGGIMLVEPNRASMLTKAIDRSGKHFDNEQGGGNVELFQEDLIRGYHADILDVDKGDWQSLCRRDGLIELVDTLDSVTVDDEEGPLRLGVTQAADGENPDIVKLYEGMLAWNGWSLTAPPPGCGVPTDDDAGQAEELSNKAPVGMTFQANFTARKGSLPSLRYGHTYRMRVRVSDLVLNAEPYTPKDVHPKPAASPPLTYRRFEPVESPAFALGRTGGVVEKPGDGESMNRLAIRTFNDTPDKNTKQIQTKARRHVVACRTSVKQAETHGMLDDTSGKLDPSTYGMLATRDTPLELVKLSFDGVDQDYPVADDGFTLPYLPDPFAEKVAIRFLGPASVGVTALPDVAYYKASVSSDWPDAQPFQIVIEENTGTQPKFNADPANRVLNVPLAKADIVRMRLSHVLPKGGLAHMGVWQWFLDRFGGKQQLVDEAAKLALEGGNWTLTPWVEIELIHAVQKPLVKPEIKKLFISRARSATFARLNFYTPVDTHSTDKLDLFGRWNEPQDPLNEAGPENIIRRGHANERKLDYSEAPGMAPPGEVSYIRIKHEFGDTKYRRILYRLEATSRFREFMPPAIREPLVSGETNPQIKVISDEITGWVPNSAPPPAPEVLYVVPTFGWTRTKADGKLTSWRDGGGLRVYLNRPWFVSGHNEMLAVVLPPDNATRAQIDTELKPFVSQWGTDPIWGSTNIATPSPGLVSLPMTVKKGPLDPARLPAFVPDEEADLPAEDFNIGPLVNPTLPAASPLRVNVAPHMVEYDSDRQLWYCDIVVDPGRSYYPFIRLALARYHPISASGAHISPIVTTEFVQLTPDRLASITPSGRGRFTVGLYGHAYTKGPSGTPSSALTRSSQKPIVVVTVEQLDESIGPDFGWATLKTAKVTKKRTIGGTRPPIKTTAGGAGTGKPSDSLVRRANQLLAARDFTSILGDPKILAILRPPAIWEGTVSLPPQGTAGKSLRIAFREYERHEIDSDHISIPEGAPDPRLRLVYAEFFKLA